MYQLHNIPVFGIKADANLGNLVEEFNVFFIGDTRHSVIKSSYSGTIYLRTVIRIWQLKTKNPKSVHNY